MDVALVMFKSDGTRRDFPMRSTRVVVGRTNNCDLRIPLSSVSREHCELVISEGQLKLRDLGSSNGTLHNDSRVQEATLVAGDRISVGPVVFTVVIDGQPVQLTPLAIAEPDKTFSSKPLPTTPEPVISDAEEDEVSAEIEEDEDEEVPATLEEDDPVAALEALAKTVAGQSLASESAKTGKPRP